MTSKMRLVVDLNEPQVATFKAMCEALRWSDYADVRIRKDGEYLSFEADWLRFMTVEREAEERR